MMDLKNWGAGTPYIGKHLNADGNGFGKNPILPPPNPALNAAGKHKKGGIMAGFMNADGAGSATTEIAATTTKTTDCGCGCNGMGNCSGTGTKYVKYMPYVMVASVATIALVLAFGTVHTKAE